MTTTKLIDIGANLTHESFAHDLDAVLARATAAGVETLVVTGATVQGSKDAAALAERFAGTLYATAGIHPHHAAEMDPGAGDTLAALLGHPANVSAGECGLDYFRDFSPRPVQRKAFAAQLELAVELGKPVFLHQREAHADFVAILDDYLPSLPRAVAHCFTGGDDELDAYLERDLYIGITGWICDERRGAHLKEIVRRIPAQRLMVETDAPYLMPRDLRPRPKSRRNEPAWLPHIVNTLAAARGEAFADTAAATTRTTRKFFALPDPETAGNSEFGASPP